ncbi:formate/nitrite transporter family protein [Nocardioides sp. dk4132]|uniref:formate/nitrite transporter family protein n=1 Tax=unclassified Nocardioides TaxID=2615069 RepID=UPI0012957C05|nr:MULTISPECIES: formate/nitrite transporter family protein [unclassified Nocardioides]MQW74883.1 formate/nitrite transporter family protein [Nocardioides sp. dk4132]QGA07926.1 formate/nitrite transporter family protein [Nocardioides sp. dk884]
MTEPPDHASDDRRTLGETEGPMEDALEESFTRQVLEGTQRLSRSWREVLVTGFVGGTEVAIGVLAFLAVLHETGSHLLAGIAFSVGFIALLLGRSELFTEGFLVPVVTVAAKRATVWQLGKLWSGTLVANLVGGWLIMWLAVLAFPSLHAVLVESGTHFATAPVNSETIALAVLAGATMTLLTRMQHGTDDMTAKIIAAVAVAFLLAGTQMFHSILDSLLIFGAIHTGDASFGYPEWGRFLLLAVLGNMAGGLGLVTVLRLVRSKDRLVDERRASEQADRRGRRQP